MQGSGIIEEDQADHPLENDLDKLDSELTRSDQVDATDNTNAVDVTEMAMDHVRETMQDLTSILGKHAILTIADTYETQRAGVLVNPSYNDLVTRVRDALIRNLGEASSLWLQLDEALSEAERGIG